NAGRWIDREAKRRLCPRRADRESGREGDNGTNGSESFHHEPPLLRRRPSAARRKRLLRASSGCGVRGRDGATDEATGTLVAGADPSRSASFVPRQTTFMVRLHQGPPCVPRADGV